MKQKLVDGGMDDLLATHFAHLFIRDPIVVFNEDLQELDLNKVDHFENLQSTNWQHMRFKPPPPGNDIGWRVEVRPMEIQITDFENAAFSVFVVLITRAILSFDLNFYIPIQKTTENMETAHLRNAVTEQKFWFRKNPFPAMRQPWVLRCWDEGSKRGEEKKSVCVYSSCIYIIIPLVGGRPIEHIYSRAGISLVHNTFPNIIQEHRLFLKFGISLAIYVYTNTLFHSW